MDKFKNIFKRKQKTLIIAEDPAGIRGVISESSGICTEHLFSPGTDLKRILSFGKEQHARSVLFLRSADVRDLEVRLGHDLSSDERRSAIEYAASSALGDHSGSQRISYMDGMFHDFRSGILASYFDTEEIISLARLVRGAKMKFRGVTNFKQLFLARHFSAPDHHGDAFLFLLGSYGLAAVPERSRLVTRNLPFGLPGDLADTEWRERVQRRISTLFRGRRVCLYTPEHSAELCRVLQEISGAEMIEATNWEEAVAEGTVYFLESGCRLIHPALPPPKEKDPKASGTYAACLFLLLTLLSLGFLIGRNALTRSILQRDIAESQKKIDTVKQEKEALQSLEKQLAGQQELFAVMKQKKRVSGHLLLVLNLLARYPLQYSRITAVEERSTGIHLQGESVWQPDLSRFFTHFEGELSKYQLTLFSEGLSKDKGGRILFRSRVAPAGGGKK